MAGVLNEWGIAAFSALAVLGSGYIVVRAGRRDRDQDQHAAAKKRLDRHAVEIRHTQKAAGIDPFYPDSENEL